MSAKSLLAVLILGAALAACSDSTRPTFQTLDEKDATPEQLRGIEIQPKIGAQVPLDRRFTDEHGKAVTLGDYFGSERPVLISMGYYRCPMLCDLVLNGVIQALKEIEWEPGDQFEIVTVSIDPREKPDLALRKKNNYVKSYGRSSAAKGWHFLTGEQADIDALASTLGFFYRYDEESNEFAHAAGLFLVSPSGKLTRCLRGIEFDPQTVRLSLVEASEGRQGSTIDSVLLWCFRYDPNRGAYSLQAEGVMKIGAALILLVLGIILVPAWLRRPHVEPEPESGGTD